MSTHPLEAADEHTQAGGVEEVDPLHVHDQVVTAVVHELHQLLTQLGRGVHINLAAEHNQLILVHTPHLEDKLKGTRLIVDLIKGDKRIQPHRVIIDHVEEHTVKIVLDAGMWAGMTLYPESKCSPPRAVDMIEIYGDERVWMNCACDWGVSDPLAVPKTALEMKKRGHTTEAIDKLVFQNPARFLGQCAKFKISG